MGPPLRFIDLFAGIGLHRNVFAGRRFEFPLMPGGSRTDAR